MPKPAKKQNQEKVRRENSELGTFVEHELPSEAEVNRFDKYLKGKTGNASVSASLSHIYQDDNGQRVNVREMDIKKRRSPFIRALLISAYVLGAALIAVGAYYWIINRSADTSAVELEISAPDTIKANEEFTYTIAYRTRENIDITNLEMTVVYPENFIFSSAEPAASENDNKWTLGDLEAHDSGKVTITGRLIARSGDSNILFADLSYRPAKLTSTFKKSTSKDIVLAGSGLDIAAVAPGSALVGQEQTLLVTLLPQETNFIDTFSIRLERSEQLAIVEPKEYPAGIERSDTGVWKVSKLESGKEIQLPIRFKFTDKKNDKEELKVRFDYEPSGSGKQYIFEEKIIPVDIIKNSLNLTLVANGQSGDQGADFGQPVNYSISYSNKGEETMENVIIMAVLDGDAIDWRGIVDKNNGKVTGSTIVWTQNEIPALKALSKDQEGTIDFTVPIRPVSEATLITNAEIKSYAQFAVGAKTEELSPQNEANRSNQLLIKINSDTAIDESARYFDDDNIAVGTGPLPPRVGETTTVKVYWKITNSLHELGALQVRTTLPSYIEWDGKQLADVGDITYDPETNEVTWRIGRLPISSQTLEAEFSIAIKPRATDRNKVMILTNGTTLTATDNQTAHEIRQVLKSQTTRLERDDIADTDGIVE